MDRSQSCTSSFFSSLTWLEEDQSSAVLLRGYNPDAALHGIEDTGIDKKETPHVTKEKKTMKKVGVDDIQKNDILTHSNFGEIKIVGVES